ncbi:MAG: hydroxymethylglutaryl-CoA synthase, partial [Leuconostoc falkenbergense]
LYTGSVYLSFLSLLSHSKDLNPGEKIAIFSYGSGAEAELYSMTLQPDFRSSIPAESVEKQLSERQHVSVEQYEKIFQSQLLDSHVNV